MAENTPADTPQESSAVAENSFLATPVICRQELCRDGHDIYIEFSLINAILIPDEWTIYPVTTTLCETTPTSWKIRIVLDKPKNLQVVSGEAKIIRTDSEKDWSVGISMEMKVYHPRFGYHTTIEPFDKSFVSGQILFVRIPNIVPSEHKDLLHEKLDLSLRLTVRECHRPITPPPKPSPVKTSKEESPKERKPFPIDKRWHHTQR